jgi:hypothetical protein
MFRSEKLIWGYVSGLEIGVTNVTHASHGHDRDQFSEKFCDRDQTLITVNHGSFWMWSFDNCYLILSDG